jgi:hypothetical protein
MIKTRKRLLLFMTGGAAGAILISLAHTRDAAKPESFSISPNKEKCLDWGRLCYKDLTDHIRLPNDKGMPEEYRGQTWAISWGNANNNEWPDLYLNHHKKDNTLGRFPNSHLILDPGKHLDTKNFISLKGDDQHSALFHDFDGDGVDELLETIGGFGGTADETNAKSFNIIHYINRTSQMPDAQSLGLEQGGARGRQVAPFTINNTLWLAFLNKDREDKKYGSNTLRQMTSGRFTPDTLTVRDCETPERCTSKPFSIEGYEALTYGLLSNDTAPDLAACQSNSFKPILLFINKEDAAKSLVARTKGKTKYRFCEQAFFPSLGQNAIVTESQSDGIHLLTYKPQANSLEIAYSFPRIRDEHSIDMATADLNNDGLPDIVSLQKSDSKVEAALAIYLSNSRDCSSSSKLSNCYRPKLITIPNTPAARNFALSDFNNDGTIDILIGAGKTKPGPTGGGKYIFLAGKSKGNWITLDLKCPNRTNAIGALAKVRIGSHEITKLKTAGIRYETQDDSRIHIGLGNTTNSHLPHVELTWANGQKTFLKEIRPNSLVSVNGGKACL